LRGWAEKVYCQEYGQYRRKKRQGARWTEGSQKHRSWWPSDAFLEARWYLDTPLKKLLWGHLPGVPISGHHLFIRRKTDCKAVKASDRSEEGKNEIGSWRKA
jgi:hypothetical protein